MRAKILWRASAFFSVAFLACTPAPQDNDNDPPGATGLRITTPPGAEIENFDLYTADGGTLISQGHATNDLVEVDPGTYLLKRYFEEDFVYARDVVVRAGEVTTIAFGAVQVTTVPDSEEAIYDLYDQTGDLLLHRPYDGNEIVPVPPGTYVLKEYFNDAFIFAQNVVVVADETTVVPLGGLLVTTAEGSEIAVYDVYDASGAELLHRPYDSDEIIPVPPGTYTLKEYFSEFIYVSDLTVEAGATTTFAMGALRYEGAAPSYDIYDASGTILLVQPESMNVTRAIPPGTYVLKEYFSDTVLAAGVVVQAGQITTVP